MKSYNGNTSFIRIRRLNYINYGRIHSEWPDILIFNKHYAAEIIENVIDNTVTCDDKIVENYPSELTMKRWKKWFCKNISHIKKLTLLENQSDQTICENLENYISSSVWQNCGACSFSDSLLYSHSYPDAGWLSSICSFIYNTGNSLLI